MRRRERLAIFAQAIEVKGDRLPHIDFDLLSGPTGRDTSRNVG
jgi:hypothetical protein